MIKSITLQVSGCKRGRLQLSSDNGMRLSETCGGTSTLPTDRVLSNFSLSDNKIQQRHTKSADERKIEQTPKNGDVQIACGFFDHPKWQILECMNWIYTYICIYCIYIYISLSLAQPNAELLPLFNWRYLYSPDRNQTRAQMEPASSFFWELDSFLQPLLPSRQCQEIKNKVQRSPQICRCGWWFQPIWKKLVKLEIFPK